MSHHKLKPTPEEQQAFEVFAKTVHANLQPSPYPESFRTYKFDRTQHLLEGWMAKGEQAQ